jgi:RNA polymerase sigma factor (sigma-70 family)
MMAELSDREVAKALRDGPASRVNAAWQEWLNRHGEQAYLVAARHLRRYELVDLAPDAVQQGSINFLVHLHHLDLSREPAPFYFTTVFHAAVDLRRGELRHRIGRAKLPARRDPDGPEVEAIRRETIDDLLGGVSAGDRELMTAFYLHDQSAAEIAEERNVAVSHVYRRLHRGRTAARRQAQQRLARV